MPVNNGFEVPSFWTLLGKTGKRPRTCYCYLDRQTGKAVKVTVEYQETDGCSDCLESKPVGRRS